MTMSPLFITYTNGKEPYVTFADKLKEEIYVLDAGDFYHLRVSGPGNNMDFFAEVNGLLYSLISKAITLRPIIVLDCDNGLTKPIGSLFKKDWDIAAVYRYPQRNEYGRQDYCSGFVALNNRNPALIKKFWIEWTYETLFWGQCDKDKFPQALKDDGWFPSWFSDQSSLNYIILPEGNQGEASEDFHKVIPGQAYETLNYKIMPLERRLYGAMPADSGDAYIIHYKGKSKAQRLG